MEGRKLTSPRRAAARRPTTTSSAARSPSASPGRRSAAKRSSLGRGRTPSPRRGWDRGITGRLDNRHSLAIVLVGEPLPQTYVTLLLQFLSGRLPPQTRIWVVGQTMKSVKIFHAEVQQQVQTEAASYAQDDWPSRVSRLKLKEFVDDMQYFPGTQVPRSPEAAAAAAGWAEYCDPETVARLCRRISLWEGGHGTHIEPCNQHRLYFLIPPAGVSATGPEVAAASRAIHMAGMTDEGWTRISLGGGDLGGEMGMRSELRALLDEAMAEDAPERIATVVPAPWPAPMPAPEPKAQSPAAARATLEKEHARLTELLGSGPHSFQWHYAVDESVTAELGGPMEIEEIAELVATGLLTSKSLLHPGKGSGVSDWLPVAEFAGTGAARLHPEIMSDLVAAQKPLTEALRAAHAANSERLEMLLEAEVQVMEAQVAVEAEEEAQQNGGGPSDLETRVDPSDGNSYTEQEFVEVYGGSWEWDAAPPPAPEQQDELLFNGGIGELRSLVRARCCRDILLSARAHCHGSLTANPVSSCRAFWGIVCAICGSRPGTRTCKPACCMLGQAATRRWRRRSIRRRRRRSGAVWGTPLSCTSRYWRRLMQRSQLR